MKVEFVCSCLCVWVCVQLCVFVSCFCVSNMLKCASACAHLYAANECVCLFLTVMYVYCSEHAFRSLLLTSIERCAKVLQHCVCDTFLQFTDRWLCLFLLRCLEQSGPRRNPEVLDEPEECFVNKEVKSHKEKDNKHSAYTWWHAALSKAHTMFFPVRNRGSDPPLLKWVVAFLGKMGVESQL